MTAPQDPSPWKPRGRVALEHELAGYPPGAVTVRVVDALLKVLPNAPALPAYATLDAAAAVVFPGLPAEVVAHAATLADGDAIAKALTVARSIDTGDTGLTIVSGVRTALSMFMGKGVGEASLSQQRTDAALKAVALAYLVTKLIPRPPAERLDLLRDLPAGRELLLYYAAIEIALPFHQEITAAGDAPFVTPLVESQSRSIAGKLLGVIGRQGMADANETLSGLLATLDDMARFVLPHTAALADNVRSVLPAALAPSVGDLPGLVAAGADALPCYRYLCARLAAESCLRLAKLEAFPEDAPGNTPPLGAPPPIPPGLATPTATPPDAGGNPFAADQPRAEDAPPHEPVSPMPVPPEPPKPVVEPTLPADQRLVGTFVKPGPPESWLVFTREGRFTTWPAAHPPPVDWDAHGRAGHVVARYRRQDPQIHFTWPDGSTTTSALARETYAIALDGERCARADFDLTGKKMDGRWRLAGGAVQLMLLADEHFAVIGGDGALPGGTGRYTLGAAAVSLTWDDGRARVYTLYSLLQPTTEAPDWLLLGGRRFERA
jgi:hypothetical protein